MASPLKPLFFALCSIVAASGTPALAEQAAPPADSVDPIDEIVVVAHKFRRSVRDVAANVSVVSDEQIAEQLVNTPEDLFRYLPGVDTPTTGTRFGADGVSIRGIGGNRVKTLIDGVPVNDGFAVGSYSNTARDLVDVGLVRRIEILRGPASALYGSDALGGVVAITTPDVFVLAGQDGMGGNVSGSWQGADDSARMAGVLAAASRNAGFLAGGSRFDGHEHDSSAMSDMPDTQDAQSTTMLLKGAVNDAAGNAWRIGWQRYEAASETNLVSTLGTGRLRNTTRLAGDDSSDVEMLSAEFDFGGGIVDDGIVRAYRRQSSSEQNTFERRDLAPRPVAIERRFAIEQESVGASLDLARSKTFGSTVHQFGGGIEVRRTDTEESRDGFETGLDDGVTTRTLLGETFPVRDFPLSRSVEWGAYIEDTITVGAFSFIAALRADSYDLEPQDDPVFAEDNPAVETVSVSETGLTPKLGVIYRLNRDTEFYLQYAGGFRAPPFADANIGLDIPLFNYRALPNPDLRSETSRSIEGGLRWQGDGAYVQLAVFDSAYRDFIESRSRVGIDPESGRVLFQSVNIGEARIYGIDAQFGKDLDGLLDGLSFDGAFYAARGRNDETGAPLNSVGPAEIVLSTSWRTADARTMVRLALSAAARWSERDMSGGELFEAPGYGVWDLFATRRLGKATRLRAGVFNLFDKTYWRWTDVGGLSPDDPVLPTLASAGRSLAVSIDLGWN